jgi:hypothetical protein
VRDFGVLSEGGGEDEKVVYGGEEEDMIRFALFRVDVAIDKGIRYLEDKKENDGWTDDIAIMTLNVVPPYFP